VKAADLVVEGASQVVTVAVGPAGPARGRVAMNDLGVVERGAVAIRGGKVVGVGPTDEIRRAFRARRRHDAEGRCVLPGFVDAHTHPVFARWRDDEFARRCRGESYEAILAAGGGILASAKALEGTPKAALVAHLRGVFDHVLLHGTTTLEAKSGYGLTHEAELKSLTAIREAARGPRCAGRRGARSRSAGPGRSAAGRGSSRA